MKSIIYIAYTIIILVGSTSASFTQETDLQSKVDDLEKKLEALEARLSVVDQRFVNLEAVDATGEIDPKAKKSINSDTLDNKEWSDYFLDNGKARNADLLDGNNSESFLGKNQKAADADKLDGKDSGSFVRSDIDKNIYGLTVFNENIRFNKSGPWEFTLGSGYMTIHYLSPLKALLSLDANSHSVSVWKDLNVKSNIYYGGQIAKSSDIRICPQIT